MKWFIFMTLNFAGSLLLGQSHENDTILLHSSYYKKYSPSNRLNQPEVLYIDSNDLFRLHGTSDLFSGVIIEEYGKYHIEGTTIDTTFYYFKTGRFKNKKLLKYQGTDINPFSKLPERYYLKEILFDSDSSFEYNAEAKLIKVMRTKVIYGVDDNTDPVEKVVTLHDYSSHIRDYHNVYELHSFGENLSQCLDIHYSISMGDTTMISRYTYEHGSYYKYATHTALDRFKDTVFYFEEYRKKQNGRGLYVAYLYEKDSCIRVPIRSQWKDGELLSISADRAIFLNEKDKIISPSEFPEIFGEQRSIQDKSGEFYPMKFLVKRIPFSENALPAEGPLIIIKYGDVDDPIGIYQKFMSSTK